MVPQEDTPIPPPTDEPFNPVDQPTDEPFNPADAPTPEDSSVILPWQSWAAPSGGTASDTIRLGKSSLPAV
jgi:hypothetical protein